MQRRLGVVLEAVPELGRHEEPLRASFEEARQHIGKIFVWALITATVQGLTGATPRSADVAALAQFFGKQPTSALKSTDAAANGRFAHLVALVLDSPMFQVR